MGNRFVIARDSLFTILSAMQPICTRRTSLDATSSILFQVGHKELSLKSTDLEVSLQASCQFSDSAIEAPHSFLVPGRRLFELVKELDGQITFMSSDSQLKLVCGGVDLTLNIKGEENFPPFPERIENLMQLESRFLLDMLAKVTFLIPQNNANPVLNGLYIEVSPNEFKMTATDGHCLAQVRSDKYALEESRKWLLPRRAVLEIKKLLEGVETPIFLGTCGNQIVFSSENFNFFSRVLGDTFPEYEAIIEHANFTPARIDRGHFIKTLRRSACLLSGQFIATALNFCPGKLSVSMENKEVGKLHEQISLEDFLGDAIDMRFYAPYLLSGLQVFDDEQVQMYLNGSSKPIIFESELKKAHILYLVMPVAPVHV